MKYPAYNKELKQLLDEDQKQIKAFSRTHYWRGDTKSKAYKQASHSHQEHQRRRTERMLQILDEIGEPSISNIGHEGAVAMSVLATHDPKRALRIVLDNFEQIYASCRQDCHYQSIPPMTDVARMLRKKPQRFGTQWLFDCNKWPFLPTVEDFAHVDERRAAYGLEPLRWPKSLALPEAEQSWLKRPFSEMVMRDPTLEEWKELDDYFGHSTKP